MINGVLVTVLACRNQAHRAFRRVGVDQIGLVCLMVVGVDDYEPARLGLADADIKSDVFLFVD